MKKIPCPHCGSSFTESVCFSPEFLQVKGFAKNLFTEAAKHGMILKGIRLCPSCSAKAQGRAVFVPKKPKQVSEPKPKATPAVQTTKLSGETFLCKGCSRQKPIEGSQALPRMARRCAVCLPSAKLWGLKIGLFKEISPKAPKAEPAKEIVVATAGTQ